MALPEVNPMTAKLMGGRQFREKLRDQLLARAEQTNDPGYAKRLREAAEGKRPLRTLLADPAFRDSMGMDDPEQTRQVDAMAADQRPPRGTPEEVREQARADLAARGIQIPTAEEARALLPEVMELQRRAASIVAEDETRGWGGSVERIAEQRRAAEEGNSDEGGSGKSDPGKGPTPQ